MLFHGLCARNSLILTGCRCLPLPQRQRQHGISSSGRSMRSNRPKRELLISLFFIFPEHFLWWSWNQVGNLSETSWGEYVNLCFWIVPYFTLRLTSWVACNCWSSVQWYKLSSDGLPYYQWLPSCCKEICSWGKHTTQGGHWVHPGKSRDPHCDSFWQHSSCNREDQWSQPTGMHIFLSCPPALPPILC